MMRQINRCTNQKVAKRVNRKIRNNCGLLRNGKGAQERATMLPATLIPHHKKHLCSVKVIHEGDLRAITLPHALQRKYPNATKNEVGSGPFPKENGGVTSKQAHKGVIIRIHLYCRRLYEKQFCRLV